MKFRRKLFGFIVVQALSAFGIFMSHGITWPIATLSGSTFLYFCLSVSAEKTILAWVEKYGTQILEVRK